MTSIRLHQLHSCPTGVGVAGTSPGASPSSHPPPAPHARSVPNGPSPGSSTPSTSSASSSVLTSRASPDLRSQQHGAPTGGQVAPASRSLCDRLRKAYKASGFTIGVVMTFIMWKYGVQSLMLQRYGLCDQLQVIAIHVSRLCSLLIMRSKTTKHCRTSATIFSVRESFSRPTKNAGSATSQLSQDES